MHVCRQTESKRAVVCLSNTGCLPFRAFSLGFVGSYCGCSEGNSRAIPGFGVWTGAWTENTSQWIADPYTFSHVLHGIFFYWLLLPLRSRLTVGSRFMIANLIEAGWEILENTPFVINYAPL